MTVVGLEIFFSTIQNELSSPEDTLVGLLHWLMINNGYIAIGKGETAPKSGEKVRESERLPRDWNGETGVYSLLYKRRGSSQECSTFLLKIISLEDCLLVNLMRHRDNQVADMSVNVRSYCCGDLSSCNSAYKNVDDLHNKLRTELLGRFDLNLTSGSPSSEQQPSGRRREPEGGEEPRREPLRARGNRREPDIGAGSDPFAVGRGDLDPLRAGTGGGMIMDPLRAGGPSREIPGGYADNRLPRGSVPPGARYDPMGPPDFDTGPGTGPRGGRFRAGPDHDHMRPPGFDDNMFL